MSEGATKPPAPRAHITAAGRLRLKSQRHFRRVYQRGRRASGEWLTVVGVLGREPEPARLGVSVSKDHGGAVRRNKLKRLLREAFRLETAHLPAGIDIVLIPKKRDENFPLAALRSELVTLVARILHAPPDDRRRRSGPRSAGSTGAGSRGGGSRGGGS